MCIEFFNSSREKQDNHGSPAQLLIIGEMGQKMTTLLPTVILSECASCKIPLVFYLEGGLIERAEFYFCYNQSLLLL